MPHAQQTGQRRKTVTARSDEGGGGGCRCGSDAHRHRGASAGPTGGQRVKARLPLWLSSGGSRDPVKRLIYVSCTEMI
jgi:hypothetical protein